MIVKIKQGRHFSNKLPKIFSARKEIKLKYSVTFLESCRYHVSEKSCVNKLFGFTNSLFSIHKNSERFGWTYDSVNIVVWRYSYNSGILTKKEIFKTAIGKENRFELRLSKKNDTFEVIYMINNLIKYRGVTNTLPKCLFYELTPYFGGNSVAPHDINLLIK